jgi:hypothetical protein
MKFRRLDDGQEFGVHAGSRGHMEMAERPHLYELIEDGAADPAGTGDETPDFGKLSVEKLLEIVGEKPDLIEAAWAAEQLRDKPRKAVAEFVAQLEELRDAAAAPAGTGDETPVV